MHKRFFPKVNEFNYGIYYIALPLSKISKEIETRSLKYNRWGLLSFYNKDHGNRDGADLNDWARRILSSHGVDKADGDIILVTMPRVLGYVFNPVSFWLCLDQAQKLRAVICEVNNTFGESHSYICAHDDQAEITADGFIEGDKFFHVSPFLERDGGYQFRFAYQNDKMGAWIDYFADNGKKQLVTVLTGKFVDLNQSSSAKAFWRYPLVTLKSILLIHWQAVKLFTKGTEYVSKPLQQGVKVTRGRTMKDNTNV